MNVTFEWDEDKNLTNFKKHGVWFAEAQTVWADELSIEYFDSLHSTEEDRFIRRGPMKKEYDLRKLKRRPGKARVLRDALKTAINIRLDSSVLAALQTEAYRMGIPYQTFIGSILHRYAANELVDKKTIDLLRRLRSE